MGLKQTKTQQKQGNKYSTRKKGRDENRKKRREKIRIFNPNNQGKDPKFLFETNT